MKTKFQHLFEETYQQIANKKYEIYFTTFVYPDPEDAEGWTSEGKDKEDALNNLKNFLLKKGYSKNELKFVRLEITPIESSANFTPFKKIQ
jgi:hypothetical protein